MKKNVFPSVGQRSGRLLVLSFSGTNTRNGKVVCKCDCGAVKELTLYSFLYSSKSCGCLVKMSLSKVATEYNGKRALPKGVAAFNRVYGHYGYQAKARGHDFLLTEKEARTLFESPCFYCGSPPSTIQIGKHGDFIYNGIDRKDNGLGYIAENCVACCNQCNWAKKDLPVKDFLRWIQRCASHISKRIQQTGTVFPTGDTAFIPKPATLPKPASTDATKGQ